MAGRQEYNIHVLAQWKETVLDKNEHQHTKGVQTWFLIKLGQFPNQSKEVNYFGSTSTTKQVTPKVSQLRLFGGSSNAITLSQKTLAFEKIWHYASIQGWVYYETLLL